MSKRRDLGLDAGAVTTRVALAREGHEPLITSIDSVPGGRAANVVAALRDVYGGGAEEPGNICIAAPDSWLNGEISGALEHEAARAAIEGAHFHDEIRWVGQMTATAALVAARAAEGAYGPCLVCDVGGTGVRAGLFAVSDHAVQQLKVAVASGGGSAEFDANVRAILGGAGLPSAAQWFAAAATQNSRATIVLRRAATDEGFRAAPVYERVGLTSDLTAGLLLDSFVPTAERLRSVTSAVLAGVTPLATFLVGGLAWFPPVLDVVGEMVTATPENLGVKAAAMGALLFARRKVQLASGSYPQVSLPAHEIRVGLLAETRLLLPWQPTPVGSAVTLMLENEDLAVDVAGTIRTVRVPGMVPGPYRISIRPGGTGRALIVLRPDYGPGQNVLVCPLDLE